MQSLDLSCWKSVRAAAEALGAAGLRIDLLINNAGIMYGNSSGARPTDSS